MNILLINHYAGSRIHGMELRPYYFAKEWLKSGNDVTIVASSSSHVRKINPQVRYSLTIENTDKVRYIWVKTPHYSGNTLKRVINILSFVFQLVRFEKKLRYLVNPDIVIASSTYPLDIIPAYIISKKSKSKLVFEVHDLWPLTPIELGGISRFHPFIIFLQLAENFAYKYSDVVVSMLPNSKIYMQQHGMHPDKFEYIPNGVVVNDWNYKKELPIEYKNFFVNLKKSYKLIIGYTGAHGIANSLDSFIKAASLLKNDTVAFVLIGHGPEKSNLQIMSKRLCLNNVFFLDSIEKVYIPTLLSKMDILYVGLKKSKLFKYGISPNKLIDYMMSGRPVIQAIDAGNDLVSASCCGITVKPEDPEAIAESINTILKLPKNEREKMGKNGKEYVIKNHDYNILANNFLSIKKLKNEKD